MLSRRPGRPGQCTLAAPKRTPAARSDAGRRPHSAFSTPNARPQPGRSAMVPRVGRVGKRELRRAAPSGRWPQWRALEAVEKAHRATLHRWVARYLTGLADRSHRPHSSPRQVTEAVEVAVAEMRWEHPRWGSRRIRLEMLRKPALGLERAWRCRRSAPSTGSCTGRDCCEPVRANGRRSRMCGLSGRGPMQLWQLDIVRAAVRSCKAGWSRPDPLAMSAGRLGERSA
jgi:hypothetical protein